MHRGRNKKQTGAMGEFSGKLMNQDEQVGDKPASAPAADVIL